MNDGIQPKGLIDRVILFFLQNKLVTFLLASFIVLFGFYIMPFEYKTDIRAPIPVDAIPDIGEKQVIVFADWHGRSPMDVEDQLTYPLTVSLQGIPGVRTVRSNSMFGFTSISIIFNDNVEYYWARSRVLERLNVAQAALPEGVIPYLGPDATALGQVFWYTVEADGFDLQELRSIQDWYIRYALQSVEGVSEVASIGGYVKEYQIDVDPEAMRRYAVGLGEVADAVRKSNIDAGAETLEFSGVEYIIRGKGFIKTTADIENTVIKEYGNVPVFIKNVAGVSLGPATRRGALDKAGTEAVGGVVTSRFGENPLLVINRVKEKIGEISPGLPAKTMPDGSVSRVKIVPFYDRTQLIRETLFTLQDTLLLQIIITCFVVFLILNHLSSSFIISLNLPLAILLTFGFMKILNVQSNLMSLGGIAIAIGTMVDMGIILCENTLRHFSEPDKEKRSLFTVFTATSEVGGAVTTAIATTVFAFLPVFALTGPEGKLFKPLAYTKTFALISSVIIALTVIPALMHLFLTPREYKKSTKIAASFGLVFLGILGWVFINPWLGAPLLLGGVYFLIVHRYVSGKLPEKKIAVITSSLAAFYVLLLLTRRWMPLGLGTGFARNLLMVLIPMLLWSGLAIIFILLYTRILARLLKVKLLFLAVPVLVTVFGLTAWMRFGREFMPALDEGSFLLMPVTMPHASIGESYDIMQKQNILISSIPEVDNVVGKLGRATTPLDPAPVDMLETVITYKPEYGPVDPETGKRERLWRDHIKSPDDIWLEIVKEADRIPGVTSASKLGPIAARIVMLQTGMRAPMGVKIFGNNLKEIEDVGYRIAELLKDVKGVRPETVIPDRIIAKPYIEIEIDRERIARYGASIRDVQDVIETAIGGIPLTYTVEGRERYPVRVRYMRELRDSPEELENVLVPTMRDSQIPLSQLSDITYVPGPMAVKSEDTFLVSYVLFDKMPGFSEVEVVENSIKYLESMRQADKLELPPGVFYSFAGTYEQQQSFQKRLLVILPLALFIIFLILYFQFRSPSMTLIVFFQLFCVWGGTFAGMWLIGREGFLNFSVLGANLRELFHLKAYNLSVPVWVGFLALFGVATDDAVVMGTYLIQKFKDRHPADISEVRSLVVSAAGRRARPCFMTTATTVLALYPILTSMGRGSEVMIPMAIPLVIGMTWELVTFYITPVLFSFLHERHLTP